MKPEILRDQLQKAIDAKAYGVRLYLRSHKTTAALGGANSYGSCYHLTYARVRDDGMVEAGEEYEDWLFDPGDVMHVVTVSGDHPDYQSKQFPGGGYT